MLGEAHTMFLIDLIGWLTFGLLVAGAAWAAWRVYGELKPRSDRDAHESLESTRDPHDSHV